MPGQVIEQISLTFSSSSWRGIDPNFPPGGQKKLDLASLDSVSFVSLGASETEGG